MNQQFTKLTNVNERKEVEEHSNIRNHPQYQYHLSNQGEQDKGRAHIIRYRHKIVCVREKLRISQKETDPYKSFPISLDGNIMANSKHSIDPYKSTICSFLNNHI